MRWSYNRERSTTVAAWLFATAFLVFAMVVVGGATRLTGSGLSITEWRPITGALPPMSNAAWLAEFDRYRHIPQYMLVNRGMTLDQFKFIYDWEWTHRLLGRLLGLVFFLPMMIFVLTKRLPRRLVWRCWVLLALGGLQGLVGWWMVASGLSVRVAVAPERLATHLGLALIVYGFAIWTGLEAWAGRPHRSDIFLSAGWRVWSAALLTLVYVQILMGALVAGDHAGLVYTDWPLMNGRLFPADYSHGGVLDTVFHSQAAVQFDHRVGAYVLFVASIAFAVATFATYRMSGALKRHAVTLAAGVSLQAALGIVTLRYAAPLTLSLAHQALAVLVLTIALSMVWRFRRH
jgi:cytochrome c oxidase assembly protein subunit 15